MKQRTNLSDEKVVRRVSGNERKGGGRGRKEKKKVRDYTAATANTTSRADLPLPDKLLTKSIFACLYSSGVMVAMVVMWPLRSL
jgi:hypothetical protein